MKAGAAIALAMVAGSPVAALDICAWGTFSLQGKVVFVDAFADIKIEIVESFPDIRVQAVTAFADDCGEWQIVDSFPDFTVQVVDAFGDLRIQWVESFPGID